MTEKQIHNYMDMAVLRSKLSYCLKRQVGSIIVKDNDIVATGYNGTISNMDNNCEDITFKCTTCNNSINKDYLDIDSMYNFKLRCSCPHCDKPIIMDIDDYHNADNFTYKTKNTVVHAEQNAITNAARNGVSINNTSIFVTTLPCIKCATLIIQSGIKTVYYKDTFKNGISINILLECGVEVKQIL